MRTIQDILALNPSERKSLYEAIGIEKVVIDNNVFTGYGIFSFLWEKTLVKSPIRSSNGAIDNLNSYAWFLTPHLSINFSMMSIEQYRTFMKLIYSKNEFTVTCYDTIYNVSTTNKMYFATEEMPKLYTIAQTFANADDNYIELLGIENYTVEMIGTNSEVENVTITYQLNKPSAVTWTDATSATETFAKNTTTGVGNSAVISVGGEETRISGITFDDGYRFQYWNTKADGTGFKYIDGDEYMFAGDATLYATWAVSA